MIDADTRKPELFRLSGREYVAVAPDKSGWLVAETLGVRLRWNSRRRRLRIESLVDSKRSIEV